MVYFRRTIPVPLNLANVHIAMFLTCYYCTVGAPPLEISCIKPRDAIKRMSLTSMNNITLYVGASENELIRNKRKNAFFFSLKRRREKTGKKSGKLNFFVPLCLGDLLFICFVRRVQTQVGTPSCYIDTEVLSSTRTIFHLRSEKTKEE